jgi:hypothetical protein
MKILVRGGTPRTTNAGLAGRIGRATVFSAAKFFGTAEFRVDELFADSAPEAWGEGVPKADTTGGARVGD